MASIFIAAGILFHNKVKDKREERKDKKRQQYERRYTELEHEHQAYEKQQLERRKTIDSGLVNDPDRVEQRPGHERRKSSESIRSANSGDDNPSRWVDEVCKERTKSK